MEATGELTCRLCCCMEGGISTNSRLVRAVPLPEGGPAYVRPAIRMAPARHWTPSGLKIVVEKHLAGYVAYPLGVKGAVVGQGDTFEEALADVKSAIRFFIETFGEEALLG